MTDEKLFFAAAAHAKNVMARVKADADCQTAKDKRDEALKTEQATYRHLTTFVQAKDPVRCVLVDGMIVRVQFIEGGVSVTVDRLAE